MKMNKNSYTKEPINKTNEVECEPIEDNVTVEHIIGTVSNCNHLNIRKEPGIPSDVIGIIPAGTIVTIELDKSTEGWYKVILEDGLEGFCMNCYVTCE